MVNSYELDERGYGMCRCCRKKLSIGDLNSCLYCDRWVCKSCAIKSKRIDDAYVCKVCKRSER